MVDDGSHIDEIFRDRFSDVTDASYKPEYWANLEQQLNATNAPGAAAAATGGKGAAGFLTTKNIALGITSIAVLGTASWYFTSQLDHSSSLVAASKEEAVVEGMLISSAPMQASWGMAAPTASNTISWENAQQQAAKAPMLRDDSKSAPYFESVQTVPAEQALALVAGNSSTNNIEQVASTISTPSKALLVVGTLSGVTPVTSKQIGLNPGNRSAAGLAGPSDENTVAEENEITLPVLETAMTKKITETNYLGHGVQPKMPREWMDLMSSKGFGNRQKPAVAKRPSHQRPELLPGSFAKNEWTLTGGVNASQGLNTTGQSTGFNTNLTVGAGFEHFVSRRVGLLVEAQYVRRSGYELERSSKQIEYFLQPTTTTQYVTTESAQYLHLPITLRYRVKNRHSLIGGGFASAVMEAKNERRKTIDSPEGFEEELIGKRKGYTEGLNPVQFGIVVGYEYQALEFLQLGLRFNHGMNGVTNKEYFDKATSGRGLEEIQLLVRLKVF